MLSATTHQPRGRSRPAETGDHRSVSRVLAPTSCEADRSGRPSPRRAHPRRNMLALARAEPVRPCSAIHFAAVIEFADAVGKFSAGRLCEATLQPKTKVLFLRRSV